MISLQRLSKQHFPHLYRRVRTVFFPLVDKLRAHRRNKFVKSVKKSVRVLGQSFSIVLEPTNGFIDAHIYATGKYEEDILSVMQSHLPVDGTFVDIGGNIGWHSLFAASRVGNSGHVYTCEPIPRLAEQLKNSVSDNNWDSRVTVYNTACGAESGKASLHINAKNIGGSSIYGVSTEVLDIIVTTGDELLKNVQSIDLIKIDTEGFELSVLQGLDQTIKRTTPVMIIEFSPSFWGEKSSENGITFFSFIRSHSYSIYDLENGHQEITKDEDWIESFTKLQTNLLCLPR